MSPREEALVRALEEIAEPDQRVIRDSKPDAMHCLEAVTHVLNACREKARKALAAYATPAPEEKPALPLGHAFYKPKVRINDRCSVWVLDRECGQPDAAHAPAQAAKPAPADGGER